MKKNKSKKELNVLINNNVNNKETIENAWKEEIKQRINQFKQGKIKTIAYEEILEQNKLKFNS